MIIGIITALMILVGSGGGAGYSMAELRDAVIELIPEKDRQQEIVGLTLEIDREIQDYTEHVATASGRAADLLGNYDATRADIGNFVARENWRRDKVFERLLDARLAVRAQVTADEWEEIQELAADKAMETGSD